MISSYRMANARISGRGLDFEREKIIRLGQCEKSMRYASCRVWTKREEKEHRMVLRISRGEGEKMHFLYFRSRLFANGSSRNVEIYGEKDSLKDFSV